MDELILNGTVTRTTGPGKRDTDCPICQQDMEKDPTFTHHACRHVFHHECLNIWVQTFAHRQTAVISCPMCKGAIGQRFLQLGQIHPSTGESKRWEDIIRAASRRAKSIKRISADLSESNGDIAGVHLRILLGLFKEEAEIRSLLPCHGLAYFRRIENTLLWVEFPYFWDRSVALNNLSVESGAAYPVLPFTTASAEQLLFPPMRWISAETSRSLNLSTPGHQEPIKIGACPAYLNKREWKRAQRLFRKFQKAINEIREQFSRSDRDLTVVDQKLVAVAYRCWLVQNRMLRVKFQNFLDVSRFMEGRQ